MLPLPLLGIGLIAAGVAVLFRTENRRLSDGTKSAKHGASGPDRDMAGEQRGGNRTSDGSGRVAQFKPKRNKPDAGLVISNVDNRARDKPSDNSGGEHDATSRHSSTEPLTNGDQETKSGSATKPEKSEGRTKAKAKAETPVTEGENE